MSRQPSPLTDVISLVRLTRLLRQETPDIVHATTPKAGLLGTMAARAAGIPSVVLSLFGLPQMTRSGWQKALLDLLSRTSCRLADLVWCDSPSMRRHVIREKLCPPRKVVVLGQGSVNGIDALGRFSPAQYGEGTRERIRHSYGIPTDALVLGFVGRIVCDKGLRELIQAWRGLRERFPLLHLLPVGIFEPQDPLPPADEALLRSDPRVHLAGWRTDIPEHLTAMDLFANPSYREGFGVANLEASAMGLPVVATTIPGCVDSVQNGITGTLVPPREALALEETLAAYLLDPSLRRKHGQAGRARVLAHFRPETLSREVEGMYRGLAKRKESPPPTPVTPCQS